MHNLPKEMSVLHQTNLTLVQVLAAGNDAIRATALVLLHLPYIVKETRRDRPQYWALRPPAKRPARRAVDALGEIAQKQGVAVSELLESGRLNEGQLAQDMWRWYQDPDSEY